MLPVNLRAPGPHTHTTLLLHHPIIVTSLERHVVSNHWEFGCFIQQVVAVNHNRIIKALHYWCFVRWLVDRPTINTTNHHISLLLILSVMNGHPCQWVYTRERKAFRAIFKPFHKSQCALRYLDLMSKIQNTSSQSSLATWLTVTANEQNDDWPAHVSLMSVQPVIGWPKDGVARHWSRIIHRPRPMSICHCHAYKINKIR